VCENGSVTDKHCSGNKDGNERKGDAGCKARDSGGGMPHQRNCTSEIGSMRGLMTSLQEGEGQMWGLEVPPKRG
jgi:hypothetical protein